LVAAAVAGNLGLPLAPPVVQRAWAEAVAVRRAVANNDGEKAARQVVAVERGG
jgi:hypothetical protein